MNQTESGAAIEAPSKRKRRSAADHAKRLAAFKERQRKAARLMIANEPTDIVQPDEPGPAGGCVQ